MSTLKVPIQINGGDTVPSELKDRELYVDSNGYLYVGKQPNDSTSSVEKIRSGKSDEAYKIFNENGLEINTADGGTVDGDGNTKVVAKLGGFRVLSTNDKFLPGALQGVNNSFNICPDGRIYASELRSTQRIVLSTDDNSDVCGYDFPSNPINGQLFFKIVE